MNYDRHTKPLRDLIRENYAIGETKGWHKERQFRPRIAAAERLVYSPAFSKGLQAAGYRRDHHGNGAGMTTKKLPKLTPAILEQIKALVDYNWESELKDASMQVFETGEVPDEHAFHTLVALDNWSRGVNFTVERYLEEQHGKDREA